MQNDRQADPTSASFRCTVELFGGLSLRLPGQRPTTRFRTQKAAALLAYLAVHRDRMHSREVLMEMLWPESSGGRMSLSVALSSLRAQMEPPGVPAGSVVVSDRTHVGLNPAAVVTDVHQFEAWLDRAEQAGDPVEAAALRTRAIDLYRSDLMPGYYEGWINPLHHRLTDQYLNAVRALTSYFEAAGQPGEALEFARRAAQADPLSEEAGHELIRLLIACDQGAAALAQYRRMEAHFLEALGEPLPEATRLLVAPLTSPPPGDGPSASATGFEARPARNGASAAAVSTAATPDARRGVLPGSAAAVASVAVAVAPVSAAAAAPQSAAPPRALAPAVAPNLAETPLPLPLTRFYGREDELHRLRHLLGDPSARLLTITGPGGIGKTRVALALLADLRERRGGGGGSGGGGDDNDNTDAEDASDWLDDVPPLMRDFADPDTRGGGYEGATFFVPLAHVTDASHLPAALREAVGATDPAGRGGGAGEGRDPLEAVVRVLSATPRPLLTLDNFEHLAEEGAETVEALLMRVPNLTCLVTSRQKLLLEGEHEFALDSLPTPGAVGLQDGDLPHGGGGAPAEALDPEMVMRRSPAVALFVDRAQHARPEFQITTRNAAAITDLVTRLEGIPLAIELAAARAQVLTPHQILEQFDRRFDLLVNRTRSRGTLERHRSLRATLAWSYDLLPDPNLQKLFARLSVFRGGFDAEAAQAVALDASRDRGLRGVYLLDALAQLCDASLIRSEESADANGTPCLRFTMLETLRAFAEECLDADEREALRAAHLHYFLEAAEEAEAEARHDAAREPAQLARLDADRGNLRAALSETARAGKAEDDLNLVRFTVALYRYWRGRGNLREGSEWFALALARRERLHVLEVDGVLPREERRALETKLMNSAAILAIDRCDLNEAEALLEECRALCERNGDARGETAALNNLAIIAGRRGDLDGAIRRYALCLKRFHQIGDADAFGNTLANLGMVYSLQGRYSHARGVLSRSLVNARSRGDRRTEASRLHMLGVAELKSGRLPAADEHFRAALRLWSDVSDARGQATTLYSLGILADDRGDPRRADRLLAASLAYLAAQGMSLSSTWRQDLERVRPELGDLREADLNQTACTLLGRHSLPGGPSAGQIMPLPEAVAYALGGFDTASFRTHPF